MTGWKELETRGFVVVRQAFDQTEVKALVTDFERGAPPEKFPHGFKLVGRRGLAKVRPLIESYLEEIRSQTSLRVDSINFLTYSHYVTTKLAKKVSCLHQDFDLDFQLTGDHVNYLNFWSPIVKPDRERSNLRVIPLDVLPAEVHEKLVGGGGHRLVVENGRTVVEGRQNRFELDLDLEEHGLTIPMEAGDLIVLRGDVPHRTQDVETLRVAASIRATASCKVIERERAKVEDPRLQEMLDRCFQSLDRDSITVGEFVAFSQGSPA